MNQRPVSARQRWRGTPRLCRITSLLQTEQRERISEMGKDCALQTAAGGWSSSFKDVACIYLSWSQLPADLGTYVVVTHHPGVDPALSDQLLNE